MPGYDRTGPMGRGPMTGGGFGYCGGGYGRRAGAGRGQGRGFSRGGRGGRGGMWGQGYAPYGPDPYNGPYRPSPSEEAENLRTAAEDLRAELRAVEERLAGLDKTSGTE